MGSETLREALDGHERETREALERLVNENYEEFASLGDDLRDYAALRDKIMPGQMETKREVREGREEIARALERLEASAEEREAQARASASKRLADECGHTVSKVERLLGELDVVGGKSSASDGATGGERAGDLLASVVIGAEDREGLEMLAPAFEDDQATPSGAETDDMHRQHISGDVNERARIARSHFERSESLKVLPKARKRSFGDSRPRRPNRVLRVEAHFFGANCAHRWFKRKERERYKPLLARLHRDREV